MNCSELTHKVHAEASRFPCLSVSSMFLTAFYRMHAWIRFLTALTVVAVAPLAPHSLAQSTVDSVITNGLSDPRSVTLFENNLYVADSGNHRVLRYALDTGALTVIAGVTGRSGSNNGPGFLARFFSPKAVVPGLGGLVVADSDNHMLRLITLSGSIPLVTNLAGATRTAGFAPNQVSPLGVPALEARFNTPIGLAADGNGNIFIADSKNNAIRMLTRIQNTNVVLTVATGFLEPTAIAVGEQIGTELDLFVADTRNHAIKLVRFDIATFQMTTNRLSANLVAPSLIAGSANRSSGTNDSLFAEESLFNLPSALFWSGPNVGLIVSDTGNHTLRRVYQDPIFQDPLFQNPDILQFFERPDVTNRFSATTYAGRPGVAGLENGPLGTALFNSPAALIRDPEGDLLIADSGNNALRRIQITPRLPPLANPEIGWVDFVLDEVTGELVSKLIPVTDSIFFNDVIIAILPEPGAQAFYNVGPTPGLFEEDTIDPPTLNNRLSAPAYMNGLKPADVLSSIVSPAPALTIKANATAERRSPSGLVQARFRFQVSPPIVAGDNPAAFELKTATKGAEIYFTLDGSEPTDQSPPSLLFPQTPVIPLPVTSEVVLKARAFKRNYRPSEIATKIFQPEDFRPNEISFGFQAGEASSRFLGSAGQTFIAPITLSLLPDQKIYSMQFSLTVTNRDSAPLLTPGAFGFRSMLSEQLNDGSFRRIDPKMFERNEFEIFTNIVPQGTLITTNFIEIYRDLLFTNISQNLLGVGWQEVIGLTNLYNTRIQDLVTFSQAHDRLFLSSENRVVVGGYSFQIPVTAGSGNNYRIQINRPSAVQDAFSGDVFIDTPTNGSLSGGRINAIKDVAVVTGGLGEGELHYIVGDVAPFRWFNAGDFGDTNIVANDVFQVFQSATYGFNIPPSGTDFFDAMDACCGSDGGAIDGDVYDGSSTDIDLIKFGDGELNVADVFVSFRRSLDPSLKLFARYWINGQRVAEEVPNRFRGGLNLAQRSPAGSLANLPAETLSSLGPPVLGNPFIAFSVPDLDVRPGETKFVPVRAEVRGSHPARVMMLNVTVEALDGAPNLREPVQFYPVVGLGKPDMVNSVGLANYAAAWLDETATGIRGSAQIGVLRFGIPAEASADAAYRVHFQHASASPNGLALFPQTITDGLLTGVDRSGSSFGDGIPDHWRLRYFGSLFNYLAQAGADADGDGLDNWAEFRAGTNPNDVRSHLRLLASRSDRGIGTMGSIRLKWPAAKDRIYSIEAAPTLTAPVWRVIHSEIVGTGEDLEFLVEDLDSLDSFFRVRLVD
ncbi:MAG: chitobiase/beta-hexosaminidase C-terminal domain-containing protein [Verrucomicrobia bacterium]|nr:chitobiase/beta-hexosaminidase C-terminal domain-containing protein [Verrucomicrobiota bacterium]